MKNKGVRFIGFIILLTFAVIGFNSVLNTIDSRIIRKGHVINVEDNIVSIADTSNAIWKWEMGEEENFYLGQAVKLVMDNNHTIDTEKDDIILKIRG